MRDHFSPPAIEKHRAYTADICHRLIDGFIDNGYVDGGQITPSGSRPA